MLDAFTRHPQTVGESYFQHLLRAWSFAAAMTAGALACLVHGVFPFAFERSASRRIGELHEQMASRRAQDGLSA